MEQGRPSETQHWQSVSTPGLLALFSQMGLSKHPCENALLCPTALECDVGQGDEGQDAPPPAQPRSGHLRIQQVHLAPARLRLQKVAACSSPHSPKLRVKVQTCLFRKTGAGGGGRWGTVRGQSLKDNKSDNSLRASRVRPAGTPSGQFPEPPLLAQQPRREASLAQGLAPREALSRTGACGSCPQRPWQLREAIASWARPAELELMEPAPHSLLQGLWGMGYRPGTTHSGQHQYLSR